MHFDMTKSCFAQINFENHTKMWKNFSLTQSYKLIFDEFYLLPLLLLINKTIFSGKYFSFEKFFFKFFRFGKRNGDDNANILSSKNPEYNNENFIPYMYNLN